MAHDPQWLDNNRKKAEGFYRHVEWNRRRGILVRIYDQDESGKTAIEFERGVHDREYEQQFNGYKQCFMPDEKAVKMMMNLGFNFLKIVKVLRNVNGMQVVKEVV